MTTQRYLALILLTSALAAASAAEQSPAQAPPVRCDCLLTGVCTCGPDCDCGLVKNGKAGKTRVAGYNDERPAQAPPLDQRITDLERRVADLETLTAKTGAGPKAIADLAPVKPACCEGPGWHYDPAAGNWYRYVDAPFVPALAPTFAPQPFFGACGPGGCGGPAFVRGSAFRGFGGGMRCGPGGCR